MMAGMQQQQMMQQVRACVHVCVCVCTKCGYMCLYMCLCESRCVCACFVYTSVSASIWRERADGARLISFFIMLTSFFIIFDDTNVLD